MTLAGAHFFESIFLSIQKYRKLTNKYAVVRNTRSTPGPAPRAPDHAGHPSFEILIGAAGWRRLGPAVRARFTADAAEQTTRYDGTMAQVACNRPGYLIGQALRLFGTPLAPFAGADVPTTVDVLPHPRAGGVMWRRTYRFANRRPVVVSSTKVITRAGKLLECVGGGFGMQLRVFERNGDMHFVSTRYFWRWRGVTVSIPSWLTPGDAHVVHAEADDGRFTFTMTFTHRLFGRTFFQHGLFQERR